MPVRTVILETIHHVAKEQERTPAPLTDDRTLEESGLGSLCWAIVVARLEAQLDFDPFMESEDANFPVTLGDFSRLYDDRAK